LVEPLVENKQSANSFTLFSCGCLKEQKILSIILNVRMPTMNDSLADNHHHLFQYDKQHLIVLLDPIVYNHYVNFQQTEIYSKIHGLTDTFNYVEQNMLKKEIRNHFGTFILKLSIECHK